MEVRAGRLLSHEALDIALLSDHRGRAVGARMTMLPREVQRRHLKHVEANALRTVQSARLLARLGRDCIAAAEVCLAHQREAGLRQQLVLDVRGTRSLNASANGQ